MTRPLTACPALAVLASTRRRSTAKHAAHVRAKLGVPSRTAATAALRDRLV